MILRFLLQKSLCLSPKFLAKYILAFKEKPMTVVSVTNEIIKREQQKIAINITNGIQLEIKSEFRSHTCKIKVYFYGPGNQSHGALTIGTSPEPQGKSLGSPTNIDQNKIKLCKIQLEIAIQDGVYAIIKSTKQKGLWDSAPIITVNHEPSQHLNLTLSTILYGTQYLISIVSHKKKTYTVTALTKSAASTASHFVSYVNFLNAWWPPEAIAASIGVPPYSHPYSYNIINLAFWTTNQGPVDAALLWCNALTYVSPTNPWGTTTQQIQQAWLSLYHQYGVKVLVSAFGATDFPTSQGADPIEVAEALAKFVIDNGLDGVDLDWEDNAAMETGTGEPWLISCTQKLRELLGKPYIITHAPQAPYFMGVTKYPAGGYLKINEDVGNDIDWYNIQFYNQDSSKYDTYQTLFDSSDGWATNTAVKQIAAAGVPKEKLVVGKGVKPEDYYNTGYVPVDDLASYLRQGVEEGYQAGFMGWQFSSDTTGSWSDTLANSF
jgi:chitinase